MLLVGMIPTFVTALSVAFVGVSSLKSSLQDVIYSELKVAADALNEYYEWDIINSEDHMPAYEHDYVDSFQDKGIQLTVFVGDVRYISSIPDSSTVSGRSEGTSAKPDVWAQISAGNIYTAGKKAMDIVAMLEEDLRSLQTRFLPLRISPTIPQSRLKIFLSHLLQIPSVRSRRWMK